VSNRHASEACKHRAFLFILFAVLEPPTIPPAFTVRFALTASGDREYAQYFLREFPQLGALVSLEQMKLVRSAAGTFIAFLVLGCIAERMAFGESWLLGLIIGTVLFVPYLMYVLSSSGTWRKYQAAIQATADDVVPTTSHDVEVTVSADGVRMDDQSGASIYKWHLFDDVVVLDAHVALTFVGACNGVVIPRSAFASDDAMRQFVEGVQRWLVHLTFHQTQRLKQACARIHIDCTCGHDLFGIAADRCPECGKQWTYNHLWYEGLKRGIRIDEPQPTTKIVAAGTSQ
jgi:hypothetical protein